MGAVLAEGIQVRENEVRPGDVVGWLQGGGPVWGLVEDVDARYVYVRREGRRVALRHDDVAASAGSGRPEAVATAARRQAAAIDPARLHSAALAAGGARMTVAELLVAAGLDPRVDAAGGWICLWDHPDLFAREGRVHFRPRPPAEVAEAAARVARRRAEEAMLAELAADERRLETGEWGLEDWALARPHVNDVLTAIACGRELPAEITDQVRRRIEHRLDVLHAASGSRWPRQRTAALGLGLRDPWRDGLPRLARHQAWLAAQVDAPPPLDAGPELTTRTALWAIDAATTEDRDDAVGAVADGPGQILVEVAIADVTAGFGRRRDWDGPLAAVATTTYLPTAVVPMVPPAWGARAHSLDGGTSRPVFLLRVRLDRSTGTPSGAPELLRGRVTLTGATSYAEVDAGRGPSFWPLLEELATRMADERRARGADRIEQPEAWVVVENGLPGRLVRQKPWVGARAVIRELMILANAMIADRLARASLPAPYRVQLADGPERGVTQVRLRPGSHAGLAVARYVLATSPIRRFVDVLAQRQLAACLGAGDAMEAGQLGPLVEQAELAAGELRRWMSDADRYWKLRWLEANPGVPLNAHVERVFGEGVRIRLEPVELRLWAPPPPRGSGRGRVELVSIDAETGRIEVAWTR